MLHGPEGSLGSGTFLISNIDAAGFPQKEIEYLRSAVGDRKEYLIIFPEDDQGTDVEG